MLLQNQQPHFSQAYTSARVPRQQQAFAGQNLQSGVVNPNFNRNPNYRAANAWNYRFQPSAIQPSTTAMNQQGGNVNQAFSQHQSLTGGQFAQANMQQMGAGAAQSTNTILQPSIDISETKDDLVIACNMQNIDANNLNLTATEDSLSISAQSFIGNQPTSLHKTIPLPTSIRAEAVSADYSNGILNVRMPKKDASARKQLQVNVNDQQ